MTRLKQSYRAALLAACLMYVCPIHGQSAAERKQLEGTTSLGDAIRASAAIEPAGEIPLVTGSVAGSSKKKPVRRAPVRKPSSAKQIAPVHVIYIHGINQIGDGDSALLRKALCKDLGECDLVNPNPARVYAEGSFRAGAPAPDMTYMNYRIWDGKDEWSASAPYYKRYEISKYGRVRVILDEINWWPLVYPVKCKFMIPGDRKLAGPSKTEDGACLSPTVHDDSSSGRFLSYRWDEVKDMYGDSTVQSATVLNRSLKNGLMDWGFGDAAMALGPMREILCAGIRQLLVQATSTPETAVGSSTSTSQIFFVTHSLGSYLSIAAMDPDSLGLPSPALSAFAVTDEQTKMTADVLKHTAGFYFLANQIALLELAQLGSVTVSTAGSSDPCSVDRTATRSADGRAQIVMSLQHYGCERGPYAAANGLNAPQIVAWSAADDLLSWYVPQIVGVKVVNLPAKNKGFRIWKLLAWPVSVHGNYAENPAVLNGIFK